jgi:glycerol-3-phosphate acyltransferase PlsX
MDVKVSIDVMGGDFGPEVTLEALKQVLYSQTDVRASVFGDSDIIESLIDGSFPSDIQARVDIVHCDTIVDCDEKPSTALRNKQDSSMGQALGAVATGNSQACISAGNTGALMALSLLYLGLLPSISRPAICAEIPTALGNKLMLDLGANVDCTADQLHQFALLGALTANLALDIDSPSVRLLNVGTESGKGNKLVQAASQLLENDSSINYQGFIEGDGIFLGEADVIVCDGFSGNVALKVGEGITKHVSQQFSQKLTQGMQSSFLRFFTNFLTIDINSSIQPALFNGAYLLGVNGVVVKSHGAADVEGFTAALNRGINAARHQLPKALAPILEKHHQ